jgi:rhamnogalacturonyl hydrolase YesR
MSNVPSFYVAETYCPSMSISVTCHTAQVHGDPALTYPKCMNILKATNCYIWGVALYGVETWTLRAVDQKYLESFEMWFWRRMEKISRTDRVRNEEVLLRVKEQRNILHQLFPKCGPRTTDGPRVLPLWSS